MLTFSRARFVLGIPIPIVSLTTSIVSIHVDMQRHRSPGHNYRGVSSILRVSQLNLQFVLVRRLLVLSVTELFRKHSYWYLRYIIVMRPGALKDNEPILNVNSFLSYKCNV